MDRKYRNVCGAEGPKESDSASRSRSMETADSSSITLPSVTPAIKSQAPTVATGAATKTVRRQRIRRSARSFVGDRQDFPMRLRPMGSAHGQARSNETAARYFFFRLYS